MVARIREFWLGFAATGRHRADAAYIAPRVRSATIAPRVRSATIAPRVRSDESVALGIAHTGRVITAAALIMSVSFAALIAAHVAFIRMFGLGLTLAVLVDATLVRMVLVPAFMHVMGQWNWWAPRPLVWLHHRLGFAEGPAASVPSEKAANLV
jgi:putative drug exporter of the RND superfamily